MLITNYEYAKLKFLETIATWKKRYLTPVGKITIIKTFLLSKLNHLFITLTSPDKHFFKNINTLLYKYIWDDKPDKIKRNLINQSYSNGGLKMIDLEKFISVVEPKSVKYVFSKMV